VAAYASSEDPWEAFAAGCHAFVEACQEPGVQRIVLLDAPSALGWETIRTLEAGSLAMMETGVARAAEAGRIGPHDPRLLADLLFGAACETAMLVARAPDQRAALHDSIGELGLVLQALAS
jgi:hypothetical protein